jgi:hypothetical protein
MQFNVDYVLYSQCSNQDVSAAIAAIFRAMLLQEYKATNVVSCIAVTAKGTITPQHRPHITYTLHQNSPHHCIKHHSTKVKVKVALEQATKAQRRSRGIALLFP